MTPKATSLIADEVESLTAARAAAMSGNEPSDAVRVSQSSGRMDLKADSRSSMRS